MQSIALKRSANKNRIDLVVFAQWDWVVNSSQTFQHTWYTEKLQKLRESKNSTCNEAVYIFTYEKTGFEITTCRNIVFHKMSYQSSDFTSCSCVQIYFKALWKMLNKAKTFCTSQKYEIAAKEKYSGYFMRTILMLNRSLIANFLRKWFFSDFTCPLHLLEALNYSFFLIKIPSHLERKVFLVEFKGNI